MKKIIHYSTFIVLAITLVFNTSCKGKAKASATSTESVSQACKVTVSFGSRGDGINQAKYDELVKLLDSKKLKHSETVKGREGEKDVCIPLTELKDKEKNEMIEQLKKFEDANTFISLSIN